MGRMLLVLVVVLSFFQAFSAVAAEHSILAPPGSQLDLPFSPGVRVGDFLYLSGAIGIKPGASRVEPGIEAQMRQAMANLEQILEHADADFSRAVSVNVYLSDSRHFSAMNEIYRSYFGDGPPVRATVEADIALPGALFEMSMVAVRSGIERRVVLPAGFKTPSSPYSWAVRSGDTLFIAGVTSRNPATGELVAGDVSVQTRQVLENIGKILDADAMGYGDVVSCSVYLADARDFGAMNEVYRSFFPQAPPARATIRAGLMNPDLLVEIQCTAVADPNRSVVIAAGASPPRSPFSPAIRAGGRLFLSGFVGAGPDGFAPGDVATQTKQTLANLEATLAAAKMDWSNVFNVNVFISDVRYFGAMNEVYGATLPQPAPARATVGSLLMSPAALVEIMMVAAD